MHPDKAGTKEIAEIRRKAEKAWRALNAVGHKPIMATKRIKITSDYHVHVLLKDHASFKKTDAETVEAQSSVSQDIGQPVDTGT